MLGDLTNLNDLDLGLNVRPLGVEVVTSSILVIAQAIFHMPRLERFCLDVCPMRPHDHLWAAWWHLGHALGSLRTLKVVHVQIAPMHATMMRCLELLGDAMLANQPPQLRAIVLGDIEEPRQDRMSTTDGLQTLVLPSVEGLSHAPALMRSARIRINVLHPDFHSTYLRESASPPCAHRSYQLFATGVGVPFRS